MPRGSGAHATRTRWHYAAGENRYVYGARGLWCVSRDGKGYACWLLATRRTYKGERYISPVPFHTKTRGGAMSHILTIEPEEIKPMSTEKPFSHTALLVSLNVRAYGALKADKSAPLGSPVVPKEALEPLTAAITALRTYHHENTLPWLDDGARVLPTTHHEEFKAGLEGLKDAYDTAVRDFCDAWPEIVAKARGKNGFSAVDYPENIRDRFGIELKFSRLDGTVPDEVETPEPEGDVDTVVPPRTAEDIAARVGEFMGDGNAG